MLTWTPQFCFLPENFNFRLLYLLNIVNTVLPVFKAVLLPTLVFLFQMPTSSSSLPNAHPSLIITIIIIMIIIILSIMVVITINLTAPPLIPRTQLPNYLAPTIHSSMVRPFYTWAKICFYINVINYDIGVKAYFGLCMTHNIIGILFSMI